MPALAMVDGVGSGVYVHTGGTWVYGDTEGIVDETAPWNPPPVVAFAQPGRETGAVPYIGDGTNNWALVHVDDIATLYAAALDARAGTVYLGVGGVGPTAHEVADVLGNGSTISITLEQAREQMGPIADAFALDQRFSSARAHHDLGWKPLHDDPLAVLTSR